MAVLQRNFLGKLRAPSINIGFFFLSYFSLDSVLLILLHTLAAPDLGSACHVYRCQKPAENPLQSSNDKNQWCRTTLNTSSWGLALASQTRSKMQTGIWNKILKVRHRPQKAPRDTKMPSSTNKELFFTL